MSSVGNYQRDVFVQQSLRTQCMLDTLPWAEDRAFFTEVSTASRATPMRDVAFPTM